MASQPASGAHPDPAAVVRFGVFEFDTRTRELRKHGVRVRLQGRPCQILQALVERPGQVVTREELRQRLWPSDVFVDYESGLNTAANRLRLALGDSAENPRFIETLARTGYRFIAPSKQRTARLPRRRPGSCAPGAFRRRSWRWCSCWSWPQSAGPWRSRAATRPISSSGR